MFVYMMVRYLGIVLLCTAALPLFGQNATTPKAGSVYQLSGMVLGRDNHVPISYCRITTTRKTRLAVSDANGFFSLPVVESDTLVFSRFGFLTEMISVRQYIREYKPDAGEQYLYLIQYMIPQDFILDSIVVRPYNTPLELRTAVLNLPTQTPLSIETINHRVDAETMAYFMNNLPADDADRLSVARQRYIDYYQRKGTVTNVGVDPIAVYNFIKLINDRKKQ